MDGEARRDSIVDILTNSEKPVSGASLAKEFNVSRQVIVQDIALIRARNIDIFSTHRGYVINESKKFTRVFKVIHSDEDVEKELVTVIDMGGSFEDVFVYHKVYGVVKAEMKLKSRNDVNKYLQELKAGKSSLLKNVTSGYHYHTVLADSEKILDDIQEKLNEYGFLATLQEYEPVDFEKKMSKSSC